MRVRLKGINSKRARLADGREVRYWYAWKGGPRLPGRPGSPEFIAAYNEAVAARTRPKAGELQSLLTGFQHSQAFLQLADRTRRDYVHQIKRIERAFSDFPLAALDDPRASGIFLKWRDQLALASLRQADYAWQVLARVFSWAKRHGEIRRNPCEKGDRLYSVDRRDKVWTPADETAFLAAAPVHLRLPILLALWTGQRQGDLLRLPWSAYDGGVIRLKQSKGGVKIAIPVGAPLKAALDTTPRRSPVILTNLRGKPWTGDGFRSAWRKACARAGVAGLTFHDLRGTAVTRLAVAGCTESEIATVTGHALRDVRSILDAHYLSRDPRLAESAIAKLERHQTGTGTPE